HDLICRRLLEAWHADHVYASTRVVTTITAPAPAGIVDHYESRGTAVEAAGWKVLEVGYGKPAAKARGEGRGKARGGPGAGAGEAEAADQALPAGLVRGQAQRVL